MPRVLVWQAAAIVLCILSQLHLRDRVQAVILGCETGPRAAGASVRGMRTERPVEAIILTRLDAAVAYCE